MKFPFNSLFKEKNIPVIMLVQIFICMTLIVLVLPINSRKETRFEESVLCDFYVNATEWRSGYAEYHVFDEFACQNEQAALRSYRRAIGVESGLCEKGMCLDSAQVTLYKSCPDNDDVVVVRDTFMYF